MSTYLRSIEAIYPENYTRRLKTCQSCGCKYTDITQRNVGNSCSKSCASKRMSMTRRQNGSYVRTVEANIKTSKTLKRIYASGERIISDAQRFAGGKTVSRLTKEGKCPLIMGDAHWTKTDEAREFLRKKFTGRQFTLEQRQKMSIAQSNRVRTKRESLYTSARGGWRHDIGMYFRSRWEANFARYLSYLGKEWKFEPKSFLLTENLSYVPDFLCEGIWYEIKGRMTEKCIRQIDLFQKLGHELKVIGPKEYRLLLTKYRNIIPNWEGNK